MTGDNRHIRIDCKAISGSIDIVKSKSILHRYLICSFLSGDIERVLNIESVAGKLSDDVKATGDCLIELNRGAEYTRLICGESGTTMRFMLPLVAAFGRPAELILDGSLKGRPFSELAKELIGHGADILVDGSKIIVNGKLKPGIYRVPGNISSQYISGLLLALSVVDGRSEIIVDGQIKSEPYIELTRDIMKNFGISTEREENDRETTYSIRGGQRYFPEKTPEEIIEGDWSAGAMWLVANEALDGSIDIRGLKKDSLQGDRVIVGILDEFNDAVSQSNNRKLEFDLSDYPDIVPAVALRAVIADKGTETTISQIGTLRYKESDRLSAIQEILSKLGGMIRIEGDSLIISGIRSSLKGTKETIDVRGDHRMAMLAAMASVVTEEPVKINNADCVNKSYPGFWEDIIKLGGVIDIL